MRKSRLKIFGCKTIAMLACAMATVSACTHVAGVVVGRNGKGVPTAVLSLGRPSDIAHYGTHPVDASGHFDFYIGPADETNLYVYDSTGDPMATMQQIDPDSVNDHMRIQLGPAFPDMDPSLAPFK